MSGLEIHNWWQELSAEVQSYLWNSYLMGDRIETVEKIETLYYKMRQCNCT